jgi:hypothetical protein
MDMPYFQELHYYFLWVQDNHMQTFSHMASHNWIPLMQEFHGHI